jgi:hypothetical protein
MAAHSRSTAASLTAFVAGAVFAMVTSGSLVEERSSSGSPSVALVANALITFGAVLVLGLVQRRVVPLARRVILPQALGAVCGILLVHLALWAGLLETPVWLSERPAQFVNDAVSVFSALAIVWACARRLDLRFLLGALLVVTAYRVTARFWQLDVAPHGFLFHVQDLVIAQFVAAALALPLYRGMTRHAD